MLPPQAIPEIAQQAKHLTVFQRTANYCVPARNGKVDPEVIKARKADYDGIVQRLRESFFGQEHYSIPKSAPKPRPRSASASSTECGCRRLRFLAGQLSGHVLQQGSQRAVRDYIKRKIRKTVKDPQVAEKLIPRGTITGPSGNRSTPTITRPSTRTTCCWSMRRPMEASKRSPRKAFEQAVKEHECDIIVFATGSMP